MIQLTILSGKKAGVNWVARRLPVRIGRSSAADLQIEEPGVWDQHAELNVNPTDGFSLTAQPNAILSVNGQPVQETILRNGDSIELGSARLQFWIGATRQAGLGLREWLTWTAIAVISLGQVALIYFLLR